MISLIAFAIVAGCTVKPPQPVVVSPPEPPSTANRAAPESDAQRVEVVMNIDSLDSQKVAGYYVKRRAIPKSNVVAIHCPESEEISTADYKDKIESPIRDAIKANPNHIDFILLTRGIPIRLDNGGGYSVDAFLSTMDLPLTPIVKLDDNEIRSRLSPYFERNEPFDSKRYGFYLVARLDGYTVDDCKALVDRSMDAKPVKGPFFLQEDVSKKGEGYGQMEDSLVATPPPLLKRGLTVVEDKAKAFIAPADPVAAYGGWGSNDSRFNLDEYHKIRFLPGAVAETFVSTSARTFERTTGGQSLIADLIAQGVTGVKGYVSEPYTFALAKVNILFDRYTSGFTLAESFYMASPILKWKDVVIGDPICRPYAK